MVARAGIEPATFRFSGGRSYQLSYLALTALLRTSVEHRSVPWALRAKCVCLAAMATLTGLEPATSAVTGRRANQLRHRALLFNVNCHTPRNHIVRTPYGIRTRATALKGRRPRPLDEGGLSRITPGYSRHVHCGAIASLGHDDAIPQTSP